MPQPLTELAPISWQAICSRDSLQPEPYFGHSLKQVESDVHLDLNEYQQYIRPDDVRRHVASDSDTSSILSLDSQTTLSNYSSSHMTDTSPVNQDSFKPCNVGLPQVPISTSYTSQWLSSSKPLSHYFDTACIQATGQLKHSGSHARPAPSQFGLSTPCTRPPSVEQPGTFRLPYKPSRNEALAGMLTHDEPQPPSVSVQCSRRRIGSVSTPPTLRRDTDQTDSMVKLIVLFSTNLIMHIANDVEHAVAVNAPGVLPLEAFIKETLRRSKTSYSTLQIALYYLILLQHKKQERGGNTCKSMRCGRRLFLTALILASKYLQDRNYSARAWSKISGLPLKEINDNERQYLSLIDWELHVPKSYFERWCKIVLAFGRSSAAGHPQATASAPDHHKLALWSRPQAFGNSIKAWWSLHLSRIELQLVKCEIKTNDFIASLSLHQYGHALTAMLDRSLPCMGNLRCSNDQNTVFQPLAGHGDVAPIKYSPLASLPMRGVRPSSLQQQVTAPISTLDTSVSCRLPPILSTLKSYIPITTTPCLAQSSYGSVSVNRLSCGLLSRGPVSEAVNAFHDEAYETDTLSQDSNFSNTDSGYGSQSDTDSDGESSCGSQKRKHHDSILEVADSNVEILDCNDKSMFGRNYLAPRSSKVRKTRDTRFIAQGVSDNLDLLNPLVSRLEVEL